MSSSEKSHDTQASAGAAEASMSNSAAKADAIPANPSDGKVSNESHSSLRSDRPRLSAKDQLPRPSVNFTDSARSPALSVEGQLSPTSADRVFPIRSVISVDPAQTPSIKPERSDGYFHSAQHARRMSLGTGLESSGAVNSMRQRQTSAERTSSPRDTEASWQRNQQPSGSSAPGTPMPQGPPRQAPTLLNDIMADASSVASERGERSTVASERPVSTRAHSLRSIKSNSDETSPLVTARFKHVVSEGGHAIITGRDGETLQRCEDEPIHIPGAVQRFGMLVALEEQQEGKLIVRIVSENCKRLIGYTPKQLFALDSFTDILTEEQTDNLLDYVDFIRDEEADVVTNGPEVFTISIRTPLRKTQKFWCAMHVNERNPNLIICEFELEEDTENPLVPSYDANADSPQDTLNSQPTEEEFFESTHNSSRPLRVLKGARKRKGEAAAMEVFNIMSQVQEQLAAAPNLDKFLRILVGVVKELTGFHRVMVYQFDQAWNGRVVTELVDPRATRDLYKGLNFPASDIPKQARELYKINKVRMLYDRDHETARLVCRTVADLETPLDLTYSYLRAMSPIHIKYLGNMAVRSSMSISINAFEELWGLIACHSYGSEGMRVSFPIRKMCRLIGDSASRNIERLSYASRLQARKLINTVPTQNNPSGYIIASSEDLLKLFDADFGCLSIRDETKLLGHLEQTQEVLAMLEYLRMRCITNVMTTQDIKDDFPDLRYPPGFTEIAGLLLVPLSASGQDFIVFFRKGQLREVKWAGNPYEKFIKEGTEGYLEPRKSFRTWSEMVVGKCREWTEEEIETAAVLCLVYGKFIEVWRQKEAALQNSQLTRLLLANSAHEVRTPLNAIINYLEIALEGSLDQETRDNLAKSHSASKSLIYVINDLLDLTKTEEGGDLVKVEVFDLTSTLYEATDMFKGDAVRKNISYVVSDLTEGSHQVIGDQRRVRQAISNVTANAIQSTSEGGVKVEMYIAARENDHVDVEFSIADTGIGMNAKKLDALFRDLEQVQSEDDKSPLEHLALNPATSPETPKIQGRTLGLGLAVVARIVRNMNGQLRLKSEEGKGSRFIIQFPFELSQAGSNDTSRKPQLISRDSSDGGSTTPHVEEKTVTSSIRTPPPAEGMVTLIDRDDGHNFRRNSHDLSSPSSGSRRNSVGSSVSKRSQGSIKSARSNLSRASMQSGKSEADRLIEAIQEPHRVEGWKDGQQSKDRTGLAGHARPRLEKRHTTAAVPAEHAATETLLRPSSFGGTSVPEHLRERPESKVGESSVMDSGTPIRAIRMPEENVTSPSPERSRTAPVTPNERYLDASLSPASSLPVDKSPPTDTSKHLATKMRVLVAEDDPINSRIIKKRLEKLGHEVHLTVNGEECSSTYCEKPSSFDIILMDMQMPIVNGLTSAKIIRSYEKSHPEQQLSERAALNGRFPIIAVSASLVEKERPKYIEGGFDGWILKPISFDRLSDIMRGLVEKNTRKQNLYRPGRWEQGGWFEEAKSANHTAANTTPSGAPPLGEPDNIPAPAAVEVAAASDDPMAKEEETSAQSKEQIRLAEGQDAAPDSAKPSLSPPPDHGSATGSAAGESSEPAAPEEPASTDPSLTSEPSSSTPVPSSDA